LTGAKKKTHTESGLIRDTDLHFTGGTVKFRHAVFSLRSLRWASYVVTVVGAVGLLNPNLALTYDECEEEEPGRCSNGFAASKQVFVNIAGGVGQVGFWALGANILQNPPKWNSGYYKPTGWDPGKAANGAIYVPDHNSLWHASCHGCTAISPNVYPKAYPYQDQITVSLVRNPPPPTQDTCLDHSAEGCMSEGSGGGEGNPNTSLTYADGFNFNDGGEGGGLTIYCDVTDWYEWDNVNQYWRYVNTTIDVCW
jgi:hypothetical protein